MMDKIKKWALPVAVIGGVTVLLVRWGLKNQNSVILKLLGLNAPAAS